MISLTRAAKKLADRKRSRLPAVRVPFWFDGDSAKTDFALPSGWAVEQVFSDGALMRSGSGEDYTVANNGFVNTVSFSVAPAAVSVCIHAVRDV